MERKGREESERLIPANFRGSLVPVLQDFFLSLARKMGFSPDQDTHSEAP